jgi:hypothetical protein
VIRRVGSFEYRSFEVELGRSGEQDLGGQVLPHRWNNNRPTRQGEIFENGSALRVGPRLVRSSPVVLPGWGIDLRFVVFRGVGTDYV